MTWRASSGGLAPAIVALAFFAAACLHGAFANDTVNYNVVIKPFKKVLRRIGHSWEPAGTDQSVLTVPGGVACRVTCDIEGFWYCEGDDDVSQVFETAGITIVKSTKPKPKPIVKYFDAKKMKKMNNISPAPLAVLVPLKGTTSISKRFLGLGDVQFHHPTCGKIRISMVEKQNPVTTQKRVKYEAQLDFNLFVKTNILDSHTPPTPKSLAETLTKADVEDVRLTFNGVYAPHDSSRPKSDTVAHDRPTDFVKQLVGAIIDQGISVSIAAPTGANLDDTPDARAVPMDALSLEAGQISNYLVIDSSMKRCQSAVRMGRMALYVSGAQGLTDATTIRMVGNYI